MTPAGILSACDSEDDDVKEQVNKPDDYVYDVVKDNCQCYTSFAEDENENFLDMPHVLTITINSLSDSNMPASGTFRANLIRPVSFVRLSPKWLDVPIKSSKSFCWKL